MPKNPCLKEKSLPTEATALQSVFLLGKGCLWAELQNQILNKECSIDILCKCGVAL